MKKGKIIVLAAPSGCGKSTIVGRLLDGGDLDLEFAVSATTRSPRPGEVHGVNYYFLTPDQFRQAIADGLFLEYEEVYPDRFYGTLRSEIERVTSAGHNIVLDIDVNGALDIKRQYPQDATTIFIAPPSIDALRQRLEGRGTEAPEVIDQRVGRAEYEISRAPEFDYKVVNDILDDAVATTHDIILNATQR